MVVIDRTAPPPAPRLATPPRAGWFALIMIGSILTLIFGGALSAGGLWITGAVGARADDGFLATRDVELSAPVNAVTTAPSAIETSLDREAFPRINISLRAGADGGDPIFVGIGSAAEVSEYLDGVHTAEVSGVGGMSSDIQTRDVPGSGDPEPPADQTFWVASDEGSGVRELNWVIEPGEWTVVIMNADGSVGIDTVVSAGVEAPWLVPLILTNLVVSTAALLVGIPLIIVGVFGWGRGRAATVVAPRVGPYPSALTGELRGAPSRGLWLVKWLLVIPHWVVLALLWVALIVTTVFAGVAILFTGRYPRPIFDFNVGVLRWSWRVSFYAYSALGTDQYPPFSLERTDYPADFDVVYPERMSNGLVLVKSWLLAIPHLLIVAVLTGSASWGLSRAWGANDTTGAGWSLLGLLVLVAAVILLFTGRYPQQLFDFIMGINRWAFRVATYVALMRDEYPPFRLDPGATEPVATTVHSSTETTAATSSDVAGN